MPDPIRCHALIVDADRVLRQVRPLMVELPADVPLFEVAALNAALSAQAGAPLTTLCCLVGDENASPAAARVYAMQAHGPIEGEWGTALDDSVLNAALRVWRDGSARPDWTRVGWLAEMLKFVGAPLTAVTQLRTWQRSCVFAVEHRDGPKIFKASPPLFAHEPQVTQALSGAYPERFPRVYAIDAAQGWTLMARLKGPSLRNTEEVQAWADGLAAFARVQRGMRVDALIEAGCAVWSMDRLIERWRAVVADESAMLIGARDGLTADEAQAVQAVSARVVAALEVLRDGAVPLALEHGDFRANHIVRTDGGWAFYDVSDASVTHPFFSAVTLLDFEDGPARDPAVWARLRDAYLGTWADRVGVSEGLALFEAARIGALVHAVIVRYDVILPAMQPRASWAFMIPFWLRRILGRVGG